MVARQDAAGHPVDVDGQGGGAGERVELLPGPGPVGPGATQHDGPLGSGQQVGDGRDRVRVRCWWCTGPLPAADAEVVGIDRRHEHVHGQVDVDRTHAGRERGPEGGVQHLPRAARLQDRVDPLGHRPQQLELGRVLQRPHALQRQRVAPTEQDHGAVGVGRVGHAGDRIGHPGPGGHRGHPRPEGQPSVGVGGVGRGLLVTDVDDPDAPVLAPVEDRADVAARQGEQRVHPFVGEVVGDQPASVQRLTHRVLPPRLPPRR